MKSENYIEIIKIAFILGFVVIFGNAEADDKAKKLPLLMPDVQPKVVSFLHFCHYLGLRSICKV